MREAAGAADRIASGGGTEELHRAASRLDRATGLGGTVAFGGVAMTFGEAGVGRSSRESSLASAAGFLV